MKIPYYQIDAFTLEAPYTGNPAGVCMLEEWLPDARMQQVAMENNLSETAFVVPSEEGYALRWFTPTVEVSLCGHATLAPAFLIMTHLIPEQTSVWFSTQSGTLTARKQDELIEITLPERAPTPYPMPDEMEACMGIAPLEAYKAKNNLMFLYDHAEQIRALTPRMDALMELEGIGMMATAPGDTCDFVSRFFAPAAGIPEDPVTGSAHATLVPFWSDQLGKKELHARQLSPRGGELFCQSTPEGIRMAGRCRIHSEGHIFL